MKKNLTLLTLIISFQFVFSQKSEKIPRFFSDPIIVDSSSTVMIPIRYNVDLLSSSKLALWNDFYANIIFYNFQADSTKKLFQKDTFIKGFSNEYRSYYPYETNSNKKYISNDWIFYFVKESDYNKNGRIDNDDPSILYISDTNGNKLKAITSTNENAISIEVIEKQGVVLIKIQRDHNGDLNFDSKDKDYYYVRLDLNKLTLGNKIEIK